MAKSTQADQLFFDQSNLNRAKTEAIVREALDQVDDGELYLQYTESEDIVLDDGRIKSASYDIAKGFGFRAVLNEATGYAHGSILNAASLKRAADSILAVKSGAGGKVDVTPAETPPTVNIRLYSKQNPLNDHAFEKKVGLLKQIDAYTRSKSNQVVQVSASISGEWDVVKIIRGDGFEAEDLRPLVRLGISIVVTDGRKQESASYSGGGRVSYDRFLQESTWKSYVDKALKAALTKLEAKPAPAGEMPVVLGPGWCGILLHEAIGHGLEGDFNRKKTSAFAGLMGEQIASKGVTVVDDGTLENRRGSLTFDDEGTPTNRTVLIEDGKLVGYMQDRLNARLMGATPTGNGRRQSYADMPMPRMTNTYMLGGEASSEELIANVDKGIYAVNFGGGQVDITSGKYVFSATEAYMIEKGKVTYPVKGATLIGDGPTALTKIRMVGNDMELDPGIGTCGKNGQSVPVGVGQPSLLIDGITVGGTSA